MDEKNLTEFNDKDFPENMKELPDAFEDEMEDMEDKWVPDDSEEEPDIDELDFKESVIDEDLLERASKSFEKIEEEMVDQEEFTEKEGDFDDDSLDDFEEIQDPDTKVCKKD